MQAGAVISAGGLCYSTCTQLGPMCEPYVWPLNLSSIIAYYYIVANKMHISIIAVSYWKMRRVGNWALMIKKLLVTCTQYTASFAVKDDSFDLIIFHEATILKCLI